MGTIAITVTRTGAPYPLSKTYAVADSDIDNIVAAYQNEANISVTGIATIAQVWLFIVGTWAGAVKANVQAFQTVPPAPIAIT